MQELGREIGTVGPDDCVDLGMQVKRPKDAKVSQGFEDRAFQFHGKVDFA
jgi:hypothetical protein